MSPVRIVTDAEAARIRGNCASKRQAITSAAAGLVLNDIDDLLDTREALLEALEEVADGWLAAHHLLHPGNHEPAQYQAARSLITQARGVRGSELR